MKKTRIFLFHLFDYIRLALKKFLEQEERQKGLTNQSSDTENILEHIRMRIANGNKNISNN